MSPVPRSKRLRGRSRRHWCSAVKNHYSRQSCWDSSRQSRSVTWCQQTREAICTWTRFWTASRASRLRTLYRSEPLQQAILLGQFETIAIGDRVPADSRGYLYLDTLLDRITSVTIEDIVRVSQEYFTEDNRTVGYLVNDSDPEEHPRAA